MSATPNPSCSVCTYWTARAADEKARAMAGNRAAYSEGRRMRQELAEHLSRAVHSNSSGSQYEFRGTFDFMPSSHPEFGRHRKPKQTMEVVSA